MVDTRNWLCTRGVSHSCVGSFELLLLAGPHRAQVAWGDGGSARQFQAASSLVCGINGIRIRIRRGMGGHRRDTRFHCTGLLILVVKNHVAALAFQATDTSYRMLILQGIR